MESKEPGEVVPIPRKPDSVRTNLCPDEPTYKVEVAMREPAVEVPETRELPCTDNKEAGVVVPIPVNPEDSTLKRLPVLPTNKVEVAIRELAVEVPVTWRLPP